MVRTTATTAVLSGSAWLAWLDGSAGGHGYLSDLGVAGQATAPSFRASLLTIALGVLLTSLVAQHGRLLSPGTSRTIVTAMMIVSASGLGIAALVPVSADCQIPPAPGQPWLATDLVHMSGVAAAMVAAVVAAGVIAVAGSAMSIRRVSAGLSILTTVGALGCALLGLTANGTVAGVVERILLAAAVLWVATVNGMQTRSAFEPGRRFNRVPRTIV